MKKFIVLCGIVTSCAFVSGQDSNAMYLKSDTSAKMARDYLLMKNGVMMLFQKGDSIAMTSVMTLSDGTIIKQNGTLTRKNGDTLTLREGEGIYLNGRIRPKKSVPPIKKNGPSPGL